MLERSLQKPNLSLFMLLVVGEVVSSLSLLLLILLLPIIFSAYFERNRHGTYRRWLCSKGTLTLNESHRDCRLGLQHPCWSNTSLVSNVCKHLPQNTCVFHALKICLYTRRVALSTKLLPQMPQTVEWRNFRCFVKHTHTWTRNCTFLRCICTSHHEMEGRGVAWIFEVDHFGAPELPVQGGVL